MLFTSIKLYAKQQNKKKTTCSHTSIFLELMFHSSLQLTRSTVYNFSAKDHGLNNLFLFNEIQIGGVFVLCFCVKKITRNNGSEFLAIVVYVSDY